MYFCRLRTLVSTIIVVFTLAVGAVPDFDVTFAYLNFRLKGFPVSMQWLYGVTKIDVITHLSFIIDMINIYRYS